MPNELMYTRDFEIVDPRGWSDCMSTLASAQPEVYEILTEAEDAQQMLHDFTKEY